MPSSATPHAPDSAAAEPSEPRLKVHLNLQRKAALAGGGAFDHAGEVRVTPMERFDMGRTIFGGMKGTLPRLIMKDKIARDVFWSDPSVRRIEQAYAAERGARPTPEIDPELIRFMHEGCDFSMEHADGTFLEHLVFCHDYAAHHFPEHSANVALLHSILGTATNTFAMGIEKLSALEERLTPFESLHVQAFPSILRLFYEGELLEQLRANLHRLDRLVCVRFHRVIDNAPLVLEAEDLWIDLNYHLMHFVDFMPAANWGVHRTDPLLIQFEEVSRFLDAAGQRRARVEVKFPEGPSEAVGEPSTAAGRLGRLIPAPVKRHLARKTIRAYSSEVGHDLSHQLEWR